MRIQYEAKQNQMINKSHVVVMERHPVESGLNIQLSLSVNSGMAVQHLVLSCGLLVLPRCAVHVRASEGVSLLREGVQDGEDSAAAYQRGSPNQNKLQRSHSG